MTSVNVADADDAISVKRHFGLTEKRIRWLMRIAEGTGGYHPQHTQHPRQGDQHVGQRAVRSRWP